MYPALRSCEGSPRNMGMMLHFAAVKCVFAL